MGTFANQLKEVKLRLTKCNNISFKMFKNCCLSHEARYL